jgi:hypothetical protein
MADERHRQVVEDAITASLQRAMSTVPSADYLAGVRHRIAAERVRASTRRRRWSYVLAACVPMALSVATIVALRRVTPRANVLPVTATTAGVPGTAPAPMAIAPSASPVSERARRADRSSRRLHDAGAPVGAPPVFVEPGQPEALARLAASGPGPAPGPVFVVEAVQPSAPLPVLRPVDLPRFEMKALEIKPPDWGDPTSEVGGTASDSHEGRDL